ncbi:MAG: ribosome maturation factor RimM, partial [Bacteroidota bacterium]
MKQKHHTLYAVGTIVKAFGVKGDLVVRPMTDSPERFKKLKRVRVGKREEEAEEYTIESVNVEVRGVRLKLREVPDRTAAERLVRSLVFVDEKQRVIPAKGSYFIHDIVGLRVVDERDMMVGVVKEVIRMPAQD